MTGLCEANCAMRGRHVPDCADDDCRGCLRRQVGAGLRVCDLHAEGIGEDALAAPDLHRDLCLVLVRHGGDAERTSGSSVAAPVPDDAVMDARHAIRATLVRVTRTVVNERRTTLPLRSTGGRDYIDASTHALGRFVARHASWLAAHPAAGRHAIDLHRITHGPVRALAYPRGSDRLYIGDCPMAVAGPDGQDEACGTRLYQRVDQPLVICAGCGVQDTIEQWQRWMLGPAESIADAYAIAPYLAVRWMRPVDPALLRQWAARGHIHPVTEPGPTPAEPDRMTILRDDRGRTQYRLAEVVQYAWMLWGVPLVTG